MSSVSVTENSPRKQVLIFLHVFGCPSRPFPWVKASPVKRDGSSLDKDRNDRNSTCKVGALCSSVTLFLWEWDRDSTYDCDIMSDISIVLDNKRSIELQNLN